MSQELSQSPSSVSPIVPAKIGAKFPEEQQACQAITKILLSNSKNLAISKKSELCFMKGEHTKWQHNETRIIKCNGVMPADKQYNEWKNLTLQLSQEKQKSTAAKKIIDRLDVKCQYQAGQELESMEDLQLKGLIRISKKDTLEQDIEDNKMNQITNNEEQPKVPSHKRVLLFWSSWCAGSAEILHECSTQLQGPTTDIIAISMDHELSLAQEESKYSSLSNQTHQFFGGNNEYLKQVFQSDSLPKICLADSNNRIVYIGHPACLTNEIIQSFNSEITQNNQNILNQQDQQNIPEQQQLSELIPKAEYSQLKQFLRGKLKETVSKSYWHMKGSFKLSLFKITNYSCEGVKSVQYFKGLLQYDCEQQESQDILSLVDWIKATKCASSNIDIQGNIASDEIVYENFQDFAEYLCNAYSNKLKFNKIQKYSAHMSSEDTRNTASTAFIKQIDCPIQETVALSASDSQQSTLSTLDAATFGLAVAADLELFKSENCQQNLTAFEQLFANGLKYSTQPFEQFMSFGYLRKFNANEDNQQLIEILPIIDNLNKSQIIICWSSWSRDSLVRIADIAQRIKESKIECQASTVLIEGDGEEEGLRGLLNSIKEYNDHYQLVLGEESKHYSQLVFDVFDVPYVIVVNQDNEIEFAEPFKDHLVEVYVNALGNKKESRGMESGKAQEGEEKKDEEGLKITEDIRGLLKQECQNILVVLESAKKQGFEVDVDISFDYVTPILTGQGISQENGNPIEESKDSSSNTMDACKDNTTIIPSGKQDIPFSWYSDFTVRLTGSKEALDNSIEKEIINALSKLNLPENMLNIEKKYL